MHPTGLPDYMRRGFSSSCQQPPEGGTTNAQADVGCILCTYYYPTPEEWCIQCTLPDYRTTGLHAQGVFFKLPAIA
jgi:hypothetical protein